MIAIIILVVLVVAIILAAVVVMLRTAQFPLPIDEVESGEVEMVDAAAIAQRLAAAVRIPTVSHEKLELVDPEPFDLLLALLKTQYPLVFSSLLVETVNTHSLLMFWKGSESALDPVLYTSHLDVVPADPATLERWTVPPFSGEIQDGFVWGRGTLDIKSQVIAILEAVNDLLNSGFTPRRGIFLAFGADEEVGGQRGAKAIAKLLQDRGVHLAALLDEGGSMLEGVIPGVELPVALLGNAEKGYLSLKLWVEANPGHSSTPPEESAIGILARAIDRLEQNRLPVHLEVLVEMYRALGPTVDFSMQMALANLWLFSGIVKRKLLANPETAASIRTTTAPTLFNSGIKDNILPARAEAVVNFRLFPGDTIADVCEVVRRIINDPRVAFEPLESAAWEAAPVTEVDETSYQTLATTVREVFPDVVPAPYMMLGATDSRHYAGICDNLLRFSPCLGDKDDLTRVHGIDERISVESLGQMVVFFRKLIRAWDDAGL